MFIFASLLQLKLRQLQKQRKEQSTKDKTKKVMSPNFLSASKIRFMRDLDSLELPPTTSINVITAPNEEGQPLINIDIIPDEGSYEGGKFSFSLTIDDNYPINPPTVLCLNKIFHPNIDLSGRVCLNILREDWSPALDLHGVIIGLLFLFLEPNAKDPLNKEAAYIFQHNKEKFTRLVRRSMAGQSVEDEMYDYVLIA